ncbi:nuclear transport factor 2 family protein [Herpetosiphon geysericola]|uniref:Polyketide cyclase n=1 Tax=Herpetosiphon geysericola TaxID=70996 RepID=A0A0P6Z174_9CHLR|nr:nuclear transport factor 2 family protein [Herpetosiphon geysericola]KPL91037.1 polyketide cyclase [Herpetosiphon geysericola]
MPNAYEIVCKFWQLMQSNDFTAVGVVLHDDYTLDWPQSNERIRGRAAFAQINAEYPAAGVWHFTINRLVASETEACSDVSVTDGHVQARAISFFTIQDGLIIKQVEYWPEPYPAPTNRQHLVEPIG